MAKKGSRVVIDTNSLVNANDTEYSLFDRIINVKIKRARLKGNSWIYDPSLDIIIRSDYEIKQRADGSFTYTKCEIKPDIRIRYKQVSEGSKAVCVEADMTIGNFHMFTGTGQSIDSLFNATTKISSIEVHLGYFSQFPDLEKMVGSIVTDGTTEIDGAEYAYDCYYNFIGEYNTTKLEGNLLYCNYDSADADAAVYFKFTFALNESIDKQILNGIKSSILQSGAFYLKDKQEDVETFAEHVESALKSMNNKIESVWSSRVKGEADKVEDENAYAVVTIQPDTELADILYWLITMRFPYDDMTTWDTGGVIASTGEHINLPCMSEEDAAKHGLVCYTSMEAEMEFSQWKKSVALGEDFTFSFSPTEYGISLINRLSEQCFSICGTYRFINNRMCLFVDSTKWWNRRNETWKGTTLYKISSSLYKAIKKVNAKASEELKKLRTSANAVKQKIADATINTEVISNARSVVRTWFIDVTKNYANTTNIPEIVDFEDSVYELTAIYSIQMSATPEVTCPFTPCIQPFDTVKVRSRYSAGDLVDFYTNMGAAQKVNLNIINMTVDFSTTGNENIMTLKTYLSKQQETETEEEIAAFSLLR